MKRQEEHGHCDVPMYLFISLFDYICVSLLSVCLSVSLSRGLSLFPPSHIVQTKMTPSIAGDGGGPS
jgi:hypothetical protein